MNATESMLRSTQAAMDAIFGTIVPVENVLYKVRPDADVLSALDALKGHIEFDKPSGSVFFRSQDDCELIEDDNMSEPGWYGVLHRGKWEPCATAPEGAVWINRTKYLGPYCTLRMALEMFYREAGL